MDLTLKDVRVALGLTQAEVAKACEMTQGDYSKVERRNDWRLSTLRKIAHGLGGKLKLVLEVGGKEVELGR